MKDSQFHGMEPHVAPLGRRPLTIREMPWVGVFGRRLAAAGLTPNGISTLGMLLAGLACALLVTRGLGWLGDVASFLVCALLVQGRLFCNMMDGVVAVECGLKAKGGDLFNEIPDRLEDGLFLVGAGYACGNPELGWAAALLAVFTAYIRAFGASLGQGQDFGGPCAKPQRMAILTAALILAAVARGLGWGFGPLVPALWVLIVGTALTVILRTVRLYRRS